MEVEKLKRRAFHLRQLIDSSSNEQRKKQLIKDYVKIIWQISKN